MIRATLLLLSTLLISSAGTGCFGYHSHPQNPSFPVTVEQADATLEKIKENPKPLHRPLIIISGFMDPGIVGSIMYNKFHDLTGDDRIVYVQLATSATIEQCRDHVLDVVQKHFPSTRPNETVEVDVIGYSMGGLAAAYAAMPTTNTPYRQLKIATLYAISTPFQGVVMIGRRPKIHSLEFALVPGSPFLDMINAQPESFTIIPYVRLGDDDIGVKNAAPPGVIPWWLPNVPYTDPHLGAFIDSRILADIALRLRDEPPLTHDPRTPIPTLPN